MFKFIESPNSPYVRSLVSWVQFHTEKDRLIDIDEPTAKSGESPATSVTGSVTKAANHHPRDCYKVKKHRDSVVTADKFQAPDESADKAQTPGTTPQADASSTTRPARSEQSKKNLEASRALKKAARKLAKGEEQEEEVQTDEPNASGGDDTEANDWSTSGGNAGGWSDSGPPMDPNADGGNADGQGGW